MRSVTFVSESEGGEVTDDQREAYEERAGILEFDAGMTRSDAEKMAAKMVADDEEAEFMMGSDK